MISQQRLRSFSGNPSSAAKTLTVPSGRRPSTASDPAMPFTTSWIVPSPPAATTLVNPSATACRANLSAPPDPDRPGADFITAKAFELHAATSSIFSGNLVIRKIALVHPFVTWPQDEKGRWRFPGSGQRHEPAILEQNPASAGTVPPPATAPS